MTNQQQREVLQALGCDELQGYLLGLPAPVEEMEPALRAAPGVFARL